MSKVISFKKLSYTYKFGSSYFMYGIFTTLIGHDL